MDKRCKFTIQSAFHNITCCTKSTFHLVSWAQEKVIIQKCYGLVWKPSRAFLNCCPLEDPHQHWKTPRPWLRTKFETHGIPLVPQSKSRLPPNPFYPLLRTCSEHNGSKVNEQPTLPKEKLAPPSSMAACPHAKNCSAPPHPLNECSGHIMQNFAYLKLEKPINSVSPDSTGSCTSGF